MTDKSANVFTILLVALSITTFLILDGTADWPVIKSFVHNTALQDQIAAIQAQYPNEAVLYRGQSMCEDGCLRSRLVSAENDTFTLVSSTGNRQLSIGNGTSERGVFFASCRPDDVYIFGLGKDGRVYVQYPSSLNGAANLCIIGAGPYTAVALAQGRLLFIT